jgi:hypothetical protein
VRIFTSHIHPTGDLVLVPEGFSIWAALFGPIWLLLHRAWIAAALVFAAALIAGRVDHLLGTSVLALGLMLLQGLLSRDLQRWCLGRAGYAAGPVVGGADRDAALARLLDAHPILQEGLAGSRSGAAR